MPNLVKDSSISNQVLQPNKWKKKSKFGWQMDTDVVLFENHHDKINDNADAEDNMNVKGICNDNDDDSDSDNDDGEDVLDYGTNSSDSDSD
jgi:hypothetical protein